MKRHFDFCIKKQDGWYKDIVRFYPRTTHVHGFGDKIPHTWKEVYKTYYSWKVLRQYIDGEGKVIPEKTHVIFSMMFDEASVFPRLAEDIRFMIATESAIHACGLGQPSAQWDISMCENGMVKFEVFDNYHNNGFRFVLSESEAKAFCCWIDSVNTYALEHGEPA